MIGCVGKGGKVGLEVEVSGKVVWGGGEQNIRRGVSRPPLSPSIQLSVPSASRTDWVQRKKVVLAEPPNLDPGRTAPGTTPAQVKVACSSANRFSVEVRSASEPILLARPRGH